MGAGCFMSTNLTSFTGLSVTNIGSQAFSGASITSFYFGNTPPTVDATSFDGLPASGTIYCPTSAVSDYETWKESITALASWTIQGITN